MILIADCGSTKIDWCLLNNNKVEKQVFTLGVNAVMLTEEEMRQRFAEQLMPCLLYTSPSPRDAHESRMPASAC